MTCLRRKLTANPLQQMIGMSHYLTAHAASHRDDYDTPPRIGCCSVTESSSSGTC